MPMIQNQHVTLFPEPITNPRDMTLLEDQRYRTLIRREQEYLAALMYIDLLENYLDACPFFTEDTIVLARKSTGAYLGGHETL